MQTINFCFGSTALSFYFKFGQILGLFSLFEPFGVFFFLPVGAIFGVEVRLKNIFGTYKCRLSIFVLEVQPYLLVFHSAKFWAFFAFFGLFGAIFGVGVRSKNFFGTCLHRLTNFIFEVWLYLASLKHSRVEGVGHFNFNENQVVSFRLCLRLTTLGLSIDESSLILSLSRGLLLLLSYFCT